MDDGNYEILYEMLLRKEWKKKLRSPKPPLEESFLWSHVSFLSLLGFFSNSNVSIFMAQTVAAFL